jgi:hypothetical protein
VGAAARLIRNLQLSAGLITVLHVGPAVEATSVKLPFETGWTWNMMAKADPAIAHSTRHDGSLWHFCQFY